MKGCVLTDYDKSTRPKIGNWLKIDAVEFSILINPSTYIGSVENQELVSA